MSKFMADSLQSSRLVMESKNKIGSKSHKNQSTSQSKEQIKSPTKVKTIPTKISLSLGSSWQTQIRTSQSPQLATLALSQLRSLLSPAWQRPQVPQATKWLHQKDFLRRRPNSKTKDPNSKKNLKVSNLKKKRLVSTR